MEHFHVIVNRKDVSTNVIYMILIIKRRIKLIDILYGSEHEDVVFTHIKAINQDMTSKTFTNCQFTNCDFSQSDFSLAFLEDCLFKECNLSLSQFINSKLRNVRFENCKLLGISFNKIDSFIMAIHFKDCFIENCNFSDLALKASMFQQCKILESDFINTDLSESNFTYSILTGTKFNNCNLSKANFSFAKDYDINPLNNKTTKTIVTLPDAISLLKHFGFVIK